MREKLPSSLLHLRCARGRPHDAAAASVAVLRLHQDRPPPAEAAAREGEAVVTLLLARDVLGGGHDGPHVPRSVGNQLMQLVLLVLMLVRGR